MPGLPAFHDVRFPLSISFGATGGPERSVEIVSLSSGREKRNLRQAHALRRYDAGTGLRAISEIEDILNFFEARKGPLHAFRFRDPFDWKSCGQGSVITPLDQQIGVGNGVQATFQMMKTYGTLTYAYQRPLACVVAASLRVSVDGVEVLPATYQLTAPGSAITFLPGSIPANSKIVKAGFEFDVPVRFEGASLTLSLANFRAGQVQAVPLKEVLL
jgi:uncharacterized protein (TIGR02217 family)